MNNKFAVMFRDEGRSVRTANQILQVLLRATEKVDSTVFLDRDLTVKVRVYRVDRCEGFEVTTLVEGTRPETSEFLTSADVAHLICDASKLMRDQGGT